MENESESAFLVPSSASLKPVVQTRLLTIPSSQLSPNPHYIEVLLFFFYFNLSTNPLLSFSSKIPFSRKSFLMEPRKMMLILLRILLSP